MKMINGGSIALSELSNSSDPNEAVLYVEQTLTTEQKAQARSNIGVANSSTVAYLGNVVGRV